MDDDLGVAVGAELVAPVEQLGERTGSTIDPRMRARRIAVRREEGRRRLFWVGLGAALVLVLVGAVAVVASPLTTTLTTLPPWLANILAVPSPRPEAPPVTTKTLP